MDDSLRDTLLTMAAEDQRVRAERRRSVGLPPLAENIRRIREGAARDWKEQQRRFVEWARSVGWRSDP